MVIKKPAVKIAELTQLLGVECDLLIYVPDEEQGR